MRLDHVGINYSLTFKEVDTFVNPFHVEGNQKILKTENVKVKKLINISGKSTFYITDNVSFNELAQYFLMAIGFPRPSLYTYWFSLSNGLNFLKEIPENCIDNENFLDGSANVARWFKSLASGKIKMQFNVFTFTGVGLSFSIEAEEKSYEKLKKQFQKMEFFNTKPDVAETNKKNNDLANIYNFFPSLVRGKIKLRIRTINSESQKELEKDFFDRIIFFLTFVDPESFPIERRGYIFPSFADPRYVKLERENYLSKDFIDVAAALNDDNPETKKPQNELLEKFMPQVAEAFERIQNDPITLEKLRAFQDSIDDLTVEKISPNDISAEHFISIVEKDFFVIYSKFLKHNDVKQTLLQLESIRKDALSLVNPTEFEIIEQIEELYNEAISKPNLTDPDNYN